MASVNKREDTSIYHILIIGLIISIIFSWFVTEVVKNRYADYVLSVIGMQVKYDPDFNIDDLQELLDNSASKENQHIGERFLRNQGYDQTGLIILKDRFTDIFWIFCAFYIVLYIFIVVGIRRILKYIYANIRNIGNIMEHIGDKIKDENKMKHEVGDLYGLYKKSKQAVITVQQNLETLSMEKAKICEFMEDISHQLKTPLAACRLYIEHMQIFEDDVKKQKKLDQCLVQVEKMSLLVLNLLKIGKLESGKVQLDFEENVFYNSVTESISKLEVIAQSKEIEIICEGDPDMCMSYDILWMEEAIQNILKNCIEHSQYGETIKLTYAKTTHFVRILITDYGEGIDEDKVNHIFERFYTDIDNKNTDSIGIGLCLSQQVITNHYGNIYVKNNVDQPGVTFYITLPILDGTDAYNPFFSDTE